jgi:hypothetical protein
VELKLNGTFQPRIHANDVLRNNIETVEKNTESLTDASKEVGLEVNLEKYKCILLVVKRMQVTVGT